MRTSTRLSAADLKPGSSQLVCTRKIGVDRYISCNTPPCGGMVSPNVTSVRRTVNCHVHIVPILVPALDNGLYWSRRVPRVPSAVSGRIKWNDDCAVANKV